MIGARLATCTSLAAVVVASAALFLPACAAHGPRNDTWCVALQEFGNAQTDDSPHTVTLATSWMTSDGALSSRHCESNGYLPGQRLCGTLLAHSAAEFPQDNLNRTLRCLNTGGYTPPNNAFVELRHVIYTFIRMPGIDREVTLTIEYREDLLTITSERHALGDP